MIYLRIKMGGNDVEQNSHLSERQRQILEYIIEQTRKRGFPPAVREIGKALGMSSSSTVHMHLKQLEQKGYIRRDPSKPRAIEIIDNLDFKQPEIVTLPIIGQVAAGLPILAEQNTEGYFSVSADFLGSGEHFLLRVKGDSMIEAGIFEDDMVIVRSQKHANNGDIVVALLDNEATVKRYYNRGTYIELKPENQAMASIYAREVTIIGIVTGLIRKL